MKNTRNNLGRAVLMGLAALAGGSQQVQAGDIRDFFRAPFQNGLNSNREERSNTHLATLASRTVHSSKGYFVEDKILYVTMDKYKDVAKSMGVSVDVINYTGMSEGDGIEVIFTDPRTGQDVVKRPIVAPDGTIDIRPMGRIVVSDRTITDIDNELEEKAAKAGIKGGVEVNQYNPYEFGAKPYDFFIGACNVGYVQNGKLIKERSGLPMSVSIAAHKYNLGEDAKYAIVNVPRGNGSTIKAVRAVAKAQDAIAGDPRQDMSMGMNYTLIFLGNNSYKDARGLMTEIGGFLNDITGVTDSAKNTHASMDELFRRNYLQQNQGPRPPAIEKAGKVLGNIKTITGNAIGIKTDVNGLKAPAGE